MKKKIIAVLFLSFLFFSFPVYAEEYYESVIINTSFDEDFAIESIKDVFVLIEGSEGEEYEITLSKEEYRIVLTNIIKQPLSVPMAMVEGDYLGKYDITSTIEYPNETESIISLVVHSPKQKTNTTKATIASNIKEKIYGTTSSLNESNIAYEHGDGEPDITTEKTNSTNSIEKETTTQSTEEQNKEKRERVKKKTRIYSLIFGSIFVGLCIIGIIITIKIAKSNK